MITPMVSYATVTNASNGEDQGNTGYDEDEDLSDYTEIRTARDLYNIRNNMSGKYKLMNDIDLTTATASGGIYDFQGWGWNPIGSNNTYSNSAFTGCLDGQGHTIKGLRIDVGTSAISQKSYIGLFARNEGVIRNLTMTDVEISYKYISYECLLGIIAAQNNGLIKNCRINRTNIVFYESAGKSSQYSSGSGQAAVDYSYIGGIAGENGGTINDCAAEFEVTGQASGNFTYNPSSYGYIYVYVSGISNGMSGQSLIGRCYACCRSSIEAYTPKSNGVIVSTAFVKSAGINCGEGTVEDSFSTASNLTFGISMSGSVKTSYYTGGGNRSGTNAINCYYKTGYGDPSTGWTALNDLQMQEEDFFTGFDFENVWCFSDKTTYKYPQLRSSLKEVNKIEIVSEPTNNIVYGSELVYEGAVARITYDNSTTEDVELTPENTVGGNTISVGEKTVTYSYGGESASFVINVLPASIQSGSLSDAQKPSACQNLTYDGTDHTLINAPTGSIPNGYTLNYSVDGGTSWTAEIPNKKNAGNYTVKVKYVADANHVDYVGDDIEVNIGKRELRIAADAKTKKYGEDDPELTYAVSGLLNIDSITGSLTRSAGENIGQYEISQGTLAAGDNYEIIYVGSNLTITKAQTDISEAPVPNTNLIYNGQQQNLVDDENVTIHHGTLKYALGKNNRTAPTSGWCDSPTAFDAGTYYVWYKIVPTDTDRYEESEPQCLSVIVAKRNLTITANSAKKVYDGKPLTKSGFKNSELLDGDKIEKVIVSGSLTNPGRCNNVPSGAVVKRGNVDVTKNYNISYVNGTLEITAPQRLTTQYCAHIQNKGWEKVAKKNGELSGTTGSALRLEGIRIKLEGNPNVGIQYTTHVQDYGWMPWSSDGELSGTEGEAKRLEALKIQLTGKDKDKYDVHYRVHAQNVGWMNWAKNGAAAGTAGYGYRLEALQIVVVKKGESITSVVGNPTAACAEAYRDKNHGGEPQVGNATTTNVSYRTHVQNVGWQAWKTNGGFSGTSGRSLRLEGINVKLSNKDYTGGIRYKTHIQNIGWEKNWRVDGEMSGTSGRSLRLEAIEIELYGEMAKHYDIYYRVHAQDVGWMGWAANGSNAGTAGYGRRLEGIQIVLVPKGSAAPAANYGSIASVTNKPYLSR